MVIIVDLILHLKLAWGLSATLPAECPLGLCLVAPERAEQPIFGFAEFVTALALLVVLYTVTDVRIRFRILIAPVPLYLVTLVLLTFIGVGKLLADFWFAHEWPLPEVLANQVLWQSVFGLLFLFVVVSWLWFAFLRPPVFGKRNFRRFAHSLYRYILRGSDSRPIIAFS